MQEIANGLKELDHEEQHHQPQCSSDAGHIDLVISAAMTPPYPYGYGAEYVARCFIPLPTSKIFPALPPRRGDYSDT